MHDVLALARAVRSVMAGDREKSVFVTVGTTSFDELIASVTEKSLLKVCTAILIFRTYQYNYCTFATQLLVIKGYTRLTLQIGRGSYNPPTPPEVAGILLEYYRFKPSLQEDMKKASLIISHGGEFVAV